MDDCRNVSNDSTFHPNHLYVHIDVVKCSIGVTSFLLVLPLVLFHVKPFPIGATGAVLLGSTLSVLTQMVSQKEIYEILGAPDNVRTICLLLGMMIMAQYFERELLAEKLLSKVLNVDGSFHVYLFVVTAFDFLLAAVFTNDVACVALTPLILTHWKRRKVEKSPSEISILLLGIATSANIGSASTVFGNPQMALIASKTSQPLFFRSHLDMKRCVFYLWIPAFLCFVVNYGFLLIYWRILKWNETKKKSGKFYGKNVDNSARKNDGTGPETPPNAPETGKGPMEKDFKPDGSGLFHLPPQPSGDLVPPVYCRSISVESTAAIPSRIDAEIWTPSNSRLFHAVLYLGVITIVVLFLISNEDHFFDMGLVPLGVSIIAICFDAQLNQRSPCAVIKRVDWPVLVMFFGMFVWLHGLNKTNAPRYIWNRLNVGSILADQRSISSYALFYAFILLCSNVFSNVPLTIIVLELLTPCIDQTELVLYLGWLSTIAGNLTLFGSVANIIVAQKAFSTIGYRFGFFEYLKYGLVSTLILSCFGMWIIHALLRTW